MTMKSRILEISVEGAKNLPNVRLSGRRMMVFAEVSIGGHPDTKKKTDVDETRGSNPIWNTHMIFTMNDYTLLTLIFEIYTTCSMHRTKKIGEVRVPVKDLLDINSSQTCRYSVTPSENVKGAGGGEGQGELTFRYVFRKGPQMPPPPPPEIGRSNQPVNGHELEEKCKFLMTAANIAASITNAIVGNFNS